MQLLFPAVQWFSDGALSIYLKSVKPMWQCGPGLHRCCVFSSGETVNSLCYEMTFMKVNQCFIIRFP